jgi:hypothetical protein
LGLSDHVLDGSGQERKLNPRQLASDVLAKLDVSAWCEKVELAGAGFLNFRLKPAALLAVLQEAGRGEHLFFEKTAKPRTIVIDFSSPNVAKTDACRPYSFDDPWRFVGPHAAIARSSGDYG